MSVCSHKKDQTSVTATGKPSIVENWCVDRLIIIAVPFDSLNSNRVTATKL